LGSCGNSLRGGFKAWTNSSMIDTTSSAIGRVVFSLVTLCCQQKRARFGVPVVNALRGGFKAWTNSYKKLFARALSLSLSRSHGHYARWFIIMYEYDVVIEL